jgi:alpha-galactosidase
MGERIVLNVRNDGTIQGLPDDVAVEVPVRVRRNGVERERIDKIPKSLLSMALVPRMVKLEMALEAFLTGDRSILLEILYRDPRTKSNKQAEETLEEILDLPFNREMKKHYS